MQTKLGSITEVLINIITGFVFSFLIWAFVIQPLWGINLSINDSLAITGIGVFTISSIMRSYAWRRFFNRIEYK